MRCHSIECASLCATRFELTKQRSPEYSRKTPALLRPVDFPCVLAVRPHQGLDNQVTAKANKSRRTELSQDDLPELD